MVYANRKWPLAPRHKFHAKARYYGPDLQPCNKNDPGAMYLNDLELQFAQRLELARKAGRLHHWRRLTAKDSWDFNPRAKKPFRANSRATWDFILVFSMDRHKDVDASWTECKGMFKAEDLVKLRRALALYPERPLFVYTERYGHEPAQVAVDRETKKAKEKKSRKALVNALFEQQEGKK
jgi:hypothetical protein